jgi:acyl-CoA thioesterase-2
MAEDDRDPLARLLERLAPAAIGRDVFESLPATAGKRLFGGGIAAQCAMAVQLCVERDVRLHSIHGYFLRAGRPSGPLRFEVTRVRDGLSFAVRRVVARQGGEPIFEALASFTSHRDADVAHAHEPALDAALASGPDGLPDWEAIRAAETGEAPRSADAIEVRVVRPEHDRPGADAPPQRSVWMRARGRLPEDPRVHAALVVYASDRTLLRTAARLHGGLRGRLPASLDHAVWLHRAPRLDGWWIYATESPIAADARAFVHGRMLDRDGRRFATVVQEGLLRRPRQPGGRASPSTSST